jgi:hypothetical protein
MASFWVSAGIGGGLGAGYGGVAYVMGRLALRHERQRFLALCVGGMLLRMVGMLVAVGLVTALAPVRPAPFAAALVGALLCSLAAEVLVLYRRSTCAGA